MTRVEFAEVIAYIGFATGRPLADRKAVDVYFDLLGDLDAAVFQTAAKRVVLEHRWATFPTVAELREAAVESARGVVTDLTPAEAWALAWRVACDTDPECDGSFDRACKRAKVPPLVVEAIRAFGLNSLCYGEDPQGVVRGQFLKVFEQLAGRDRRMALLPAGVRAAIDTHRERVNGPVAAIAGRLAESFATPEV
jgi:hypothetical protein